MNDCLHKLDDIQYRLIGLLPELVLRILTEVIWNLPDSKCWTAVT